MRKHFCKVAAIFAASILLLCLIGCEKQESPSISFLEFDFSGVTVIHITNMHTGAHTYLEDADDVSAVCDFLSGISGKGGISSKGYYEGVYSLALYRSMDAVLNQESPILSLGFGDTDTLNHGRGSDGYPIRYTLEGMTISQVKDFLQKFEK